MTSSRPAPRRRARRRRSLRPYHQVALLVVVFLVGGLGVAVLMQPRLTHVRDHAVAADRVRPVLVQYAVWERSEIETLSSLLSAARSDAADRSAWLAGATANWTDMQRLWNAYTDVALETDTERQLRRAYEAQYAPFSDRAYALLSSPVDATEDELAGLESAYQQVRARMEAIRLYYLDELTTATGQAASESTATQTWHRQMVAAVSIVLVVLAIVVLRSLRRRDKRDVAVARLAELETRLQRALEMVREEAAIYPLVGRAVEAGVSDGPGELLVADSSRAHFHQVAVIDGGDASHCPVASPSECPATVRTQTQVFRSSRELDTCPYLTSSAPCPCSAVCVPVSVGGKAIGIVRTTGPDGRPPDDETVSTLELIARKAGEHMAMLRAFSKSQAQAQTDALTGLLNRRSIEDRVYDLDRSSTRYAVLYADLDHFKMLNDVHGHDIGDRALRLFSRVLRESIRPNDIPARYGGEEFLVVLPECDTTDAVAVAERVRARLAETLEGSSIPSFTVSLGLAAFDPGASFSEAVERADGALLLAKRSGRDQVVVAGETVLAPDPPIGVDA